MTSTILTPPTVSRPQGGTPRNPTVVHLFDKIATLNGLSLGVVSIHRPRHATIKVACLGLRGNLFAVEGYGTSGQLSAGEVLFDLFIDTSLRAQLEAFLGDHLFSQLYEVFWRNMEAAG